MKDYSKKFRVRLVIDECAKLIIPGCSGHLYAYSDTQLAWWVMNKPDARRKNSVIRRSVPTGRAVLRGEGDTEALFLFDPKDKVSHHDESDAIAASG